MLSNIYEQFSEYLDNMKSENFSTIPTCFNDIDEKIKDEGLRTDFLCFLYAKAGVGKSYFVINWIYRLLKNIQDIKILLFTLEMSTENIFDRFVQLIFKISPGEVRDFIKRNEKQIIKKLTELDFFEKVKFYDGLYNIKAIEKIIEEEKPSIIFIDHLHLINSRFSKIFERTHEITMGLVDLKKKYKTRIIALIQLKRTDREKAGNTLPLLEDGKGSGVLEESADLIIGLCRPDISSSCQEINKGQIHGYILKNRYPSHEHNTVMRWKYDRITSELKEIL